MMALHLTERARYDIDEIWYYIAQASLQSADRLINSIFKKCFQAQQSPEIGRPRDELRAGLRSLAVGTYVYAIVENSTAALAAGSGQGLFGQGAGNEDDEDADAISSALALGQITISASVSVSFEIDRGK